MIAQKISPLSLLVSQCLRLRIALRMHVCVLVPQSCLTLCDPMECSPSGSSVHGILQAKNTGVCCHSLPQGIFLTQGSNPGLLHCSQILYCLSHQGNRSYGNFLREGALAWPRYQYWRSLQYIHTIHHSLLIGSEVFWIYYTSWY